MSPNFQVFNASNCSFDYEGSLTIAGCS